MQRPGFTEQLTPARALVALGAAGACLALARPGLSWLWHQAPEHRLPLAATLQAAGWALLLSWAIALFWGRRWHGPSLLPTPPDRALAVLGLGLAAVALAELLLRDRVLVAAGHWPRPERPLVVLTLALYAACFTEVVARLGWLSLATGLLGPSRGLALATVTLASLEGATLPSTEDPGWWLGAFALALAREGLLGALALRRGWPWAALAHALYTMRLLGL